MKNFFNKLIQKINMVHINGKQISGSGNSVVIRNSRVIIDGVDVTPDSKDIKIEITGDVEELICDVVDLVTITGNVASDVTTVNGNIEIGGYVDGNVKTTNGDVKCGNVHGKVSTVNGDIKNKK